MGGLLLADIMVGDQFLTMADFSAKIMLRYTVLFAIRY